MWVESATHGDLSSCWNFNGPFLKFHFSRGPKGLEPLLEETDSENNKEVFGGILKQGRLLYHERIYEHSRANRDERFEMGNQGSANRGERIKTIE